MKENLYILAEKFYYDKKYYDAITYFEEAIKTATESSDKNSCLNYIACCNIELGNYEKAIDILETLTGNECWERPWFNLGRVHLKQGNNPKALECFNKALEIAPKECDCYFYLGVYYEKCNEYQNAIEFYQESIKFATNDYDISVACQNIGICLKRLKLYEEAIEYCEKAFRLDNNCIEALYNKAIVLLAMKEYNKALKVLEKVYNMGLDDDKVKKDIEYCTYKIRQGDFQ